MLKIYRLLQNITYSEGMALKKLSSESSSVNKNCRQGTSECIQDRRDYDIELNRKLCEQSFYKLLEQDPSKHILFIVKTIVQEGLTWDILQYLLLIC